MCGIIGVIGFKGYSATNDVYHGLNTLQHRGQDAAGLLSYDGEQIHSKKGEGLVRDVVRSKDAARLIGHAGLGHCRYPTAGGFDATLAQPFYVNAPFGLALVHNGNIVNTKELKTALQKKRPRHMDTESDSELLLNVFADHLGQAAKSERLTSSEVFSAAQKTMQSLQGGYATCILIAGQGLLAFRDPRGLRPLTLGVKKVHGKKVYAVSSEDVAFAALEYSCLGDVAPGSAVWIPFGKAPIQKKLLKSEPALCLFEFIYLARPDSTIDGISVYQARLRAGALLAKEILKTAPPIDVVVPVPDSGRTAALTIADALGVPYREGLMKNRYIGRTFIMPNQSERRSSIRQKLIPLSAELKGRRVLLVDDSIVRGNTSRAIVEMIRAAGAKKVYFASASPPIKYPDCYGIDMPTSSELIAAKKSIKQIEAFIKADKLWYLKLEDLLAACREGAKGIHFATHYFSGHYPTAGITGAKINAAAAAREKKRKSRMT